MAKQTKYIVANWKMNLTIHEGSLLLHQLDQQIEAGGDTEIILAPSFIGLQSLSLQADRQRFKLAAQNLYWRDEGAFTGEVSANQLRGLVKYAIIGHSERRNIFGERGRDIGRKVQAAIRNDIRPILCIGESALERTEDETNEVLHDHIVGGLSNLTSDDLEHVVIAYEPIWAVGSGKSVVPNDLKDVAKAIRAQVKHMFGEKSANSIPILYGGSVTPTNAKAFLDTPGVNGLLIGGASLDAKQFAKIIDKARDK